MDRFRLTRRAMLGSAAAVALAGTAKAAIPSVRFLPGTPLLPLEGFDPAATHYAVEEYIVSGTATSYTEQAPPDAEGRWHVAPAATAPYATRIVVIRPRDAAQYNGSVLVEWLNVTTGFENGPVWSMARRELIRSGWAYVGVSAQKLGIEGGTTLFGTVSAGLRDMNPARYGSLHHPGDAYSYDIFSNAGALVKSKNAGGILGGLPAKHVIAAGESQSASHLTTYVNAIDPLSRLYDGFLIYSRFGAGAPLAGGPFTPLGPNFYQRMSSALRVPTMIYETETDVLGPIGFYGARQPDTERLRIWEVAGTAHADAYLLKVSAVDTGTASYAALAAAWAPSNVLAGAKLALPYNNGPQNHYAVEAAIAGLRRWVAGGQAPPHAAPLTMIPANTLLFPAFPDLAADGDILGGVRSPWVDVPVSILRGYGNSGSPLAPYTGSALPFGAAQLARLYPGGKSEYMQRFTASLDHAIQQGFILSADRNEILGVAAISYGTSGATA